MPALFLNKISHRTAMLVLLLLAVVLGYSSFVRTIKHQHYQIFNVKTTVTWAHSDRGLYRTHTYGTVDNMLLSEDNWREYLFTALISNPENCGLIYDYRDNGNYSFFYFKKNPGQLVSGQLKDGKVQNVKPLLYDLPVTFSAVLHKENGVVQLIMDGRLVLESPAQASQGKVGLLMNSMAKPPTIFHDITINGSLGNGQKMKSEVAAPLFGGTVNAFLNFLPFYLMFFICLLLLPRTLPAFSLQGLNESPKFRKFFPALVHIFLAACFFWPFISAGEVAVFSYDNLGEIFPLFFYAKHNFVNILQGHPPWLWNPLIQNGFPFFSNHWDMIYYPLNWPVFLVPDQYLLNALTFKSFVEVALLGIFAYGFFKRELGNSRWALFSSVAYQMCSLLIFTMSIFPATSLFFAMTVYLYVLWSVPERKPLVNFLLLSMAVVLILTSANVAFIFYACLSLGIISIYYFLTVKDGKKVFMITAAGWAGGTLISSVRILSCLYGVTHSNRLAENFATIHDRAYMALRLFVPEITGWMGPDALNVLMSPNLGLVFRNLDLPSNPQNSFFVYFGVLPALLLLVSLLTPAKGRHLFWKIYAFAALGIALLWQPFWGILSILSFPLSHYSYHSIILPVGICTLIGYTGMAWEAGQLESKNFQRNLFLCLLFVAAYMLIFITYLFPHLTPVTRIIFLLFGAGIVMYFTKSFSWVALAVHVLSVALLILLTLLLVLAPIPKKEALGTELILPFLWLASAVAVLMYGYHRNQDGRDFKTILIPLGLAVVAAGIVVFSGLTDGILGSEQGLRVYAIDVLTGFVRVLILVQVGLLAFSGLQKRIFSARVIFAVLLVLTAADLIVFNARFNNITAPFYFKNAFYPKGFVYRDLAPDLLKRIDLTNYRVSHLHRKDFNANKNLVFNIPSYTGTVGYMTPRFSKLLTAFGFPKGTYMLYPEDSTDNARFLDLSAVRYFFDEKGEIVERPQSLARLNMIYAAEVIADDDVMLQRLQAGNFDPRKTVLLSQPLSVGLLAAGQDAVPVAILKNTPDRIEAKVTTTAAGILLFAESFDEGWKIIIDNKLVPVVRANYNFLACAVEPGEHQVQLIYSPVQYKRNVFLSLVGLLFFAGAAAAAFLKRN